MGLNLDLNNSILVSDYKESNSAPTPTEKRAVEQNTFTAHRPNSDIGEVALERLAKRIRYTLPTAPIQVTRPPRHEERSSSSDDELPKDLFVSDLLKQVSPSPLQAPASKKRKYEAISK